MRFSFLNDEIRSMKYYGSGDLAGGIFVKNVIDSLKTIEDNLTEINSDIVEIEDLYRYLWILSFREMVNEIDCYNIEEPIKKKIKQLSQYIDYSPARFIRYINENYESALNKESVTEVRWYEFYDMLMDLIYGKYSSGIVEEVFEYINLPESPTIALYKFAAASFEILYSGLLKSIDAISSPAAIIVSSTICKSP